MRHTTSCLTAAALAALALLPAACAHLPGQAGLTPAGRGPGALARATKGGSWTILVHVAADNDLYPFAAEDINEMESGLATLRARGDQSTRIVLLYDGAVKGDSKVVEIVPDPGAPNETVVSKTIDDQGALVDPATHEIDSGDPRLSAKFAAWGARFAPADHTLFSFWDHGSGIFRDRGNGPSKGFCWDDGGGHMNTNDLDDITGAFARAAGKRLTAFAMDACLMSHVELAYQARGTCDYMFASEELEPGHGYDYSDWLKRVAGTDRSPRAVLSALVDSCVWAYSAGGSYGPDAITFAVTDINALTGRAVPAMNAFARAAAAAIDAARPALRAARESTQVFENRDCADLVHFGERLAATDAPADVKAAAAEMAKAVRSTVVKEAHSSQFTGARGLVVYFPTPSQGYNPVYDDPAKIAFAAEGWGGFLKAYRR